jgi:hypothetical protein
MKTLSNQDIHHLPNLYQIEIQGVCVVMENPIKETLAAYNGDAIDWIKLHSGGEGHLDKRYRSRRLNVHSAGSRGAVVLLVKSETICKNNSVRGKYDQLKKYGSGYTSEGSENLSIELAESLCTALGGDDTRRLSLKPRSTIEIPSIIQYPFPFSSGRDSLQKPSGVMPFSYWMMIIQLNTK